MVADKYSFSTSHPVKFSFSKQDQTMALLKIINKFVVKEQKIAMLINALFLTFYPGVKTLVFCVSKTVRYN